MAQETSRILSDGNVQAIDTSLNSKLKDTTGQGIRAALVAYFTAAKNAIIGRLKLQDVATIESASTASKAYATGDFLAKDGNLYKATDDIAQGGTLNVGTNLEAAKLADEVSQLNSALENVEEISFSLSNLATNINANSISKKALKTRDGFVDVSISFDFSTPQTGGSAIKLFDLPNELRPSSSISDMPFESVAVNISGNSYIYTASTAFLNIFGKFYLYTAGDYTAVNLHCHYKI